MTDLSYLKRFCDDSWKEIKNSVSPTEVNEIEAAAKKYYMIIYIATQKISGYVMNGTAVISEHPLSLLKRNRLENHSASVVVTQFAEITEEQYFESWELNPAPGQYIILQDVDFVPRTP